MKKKLFPVVLLLFFVPSFVSAYGVYLSITDTTKSGVGDTFASEVEALPGFEFTDDVFLADFHVAAIITEITNGRSRIGASYAVAIVVIPSFVPTFGINLLHSLVTDPDAGVMCSEAAGELRRYFDELLPENVNYIAENYDAITGYRESEGKDVGFLK